MPRVSGGFITLCAPGVDIMTTLPRGKYNFYTGTSMATAYVTGAVALLLQKYPGLKPQKVRALLEQSAKDCGQKTAVHRAKTNSSAVASLA